MPLQENLGGEAEKGVLIGGDISTAARVSTRRRHRRGRRSGQGCRRSGRGGHPWRRGTRCRVGGVGEQPEEAAANGVLAEEDDGGGIPLPGFASRHCGQVLGAGGHGDEALLLVRSDNSEAAHR
jgi:hypothetical protein